MKNSINKIFFDIIDKIPKSKKRFTTLSMRIAGLINDKLIEEGSTNVAFAKRMKKHESQIHRWLSGEHNFTIKTIANIETELGIDLIHLPERQRVNSETFQYFLKREPIKRFGRIDKLNHNVTTLEYRTGTDG